jgi:hypothetical protein
MIGTWFNELFGEHTLDAVSAALIAAYGWAKEWQVLLTGLLVLLAALIVARAIRRAPAPRPARRDAQSQADLDLRLEPRAMSVGPKSLAEESPGELIGELEQLRSLIRSALAAFTLTAEKENSPVQFLCQRIARLHPERFALSAGAPKAQRDTHIALLEQLETLRQQLKKDAPPVEISATLVQLNTSARSLLAALAPQTAAPRRQAASDQR